MPEGEKDGWGYRPHLDGLRAVAVYLVVAFHAGSFRLSGGFIGVDVFFVLSGYLVTNLLRRDLEGEGGRIRFGRFYARRVRRLLPAAAVTLVVTAVVFASIGAGRELDDAADAIRAAALFVANWHFIGQSTDYFANDVGTSPVLHFWSLSVEEQFYFAWPLLFTGLYALARRAGRWRTHALRGAIGGLGLASALAALAIAGDNLERAYYGTDTRAYQLLAGAFLAVSPGLVARAGRLRVARLWPVASLVLLGALGLAATSSLGVDPVERGVVATVVTCALIVALEARPAGIGARLLSLAPLVYLGRISYGIYLWHWLVIVVLAREAELGTLATAAVTTVVATGIASLSYQLLELPIRQATWLDRRRLPTVAAGLAVSVLVGVVVAPAVFDRAEPDGSLVVDGAGGTYGATATFDQAQLDTAFTDTFDYDTCPSSTPTPCTLASGAGLTAMVVGDSHAGMYAPMLAELAASHDMTLYGGLLSYCPWTLGMRFQAAGADCHADQARMFDEILPSLDPDIVFLAHRPVDDANGPMGMIDVEAGVVSGAPRDELLGRRISTLVDDLVADGRTVVILEPIPVFPRDNNPLACLSLARQVDPCRFVTRATAGPEEEVIRRLAENPAVVAVDLDRLVCPYLPICDPVVAGEIVRRDDNHLTITFARTLLVPIDQYLTLEGVFD